MLTLRGRHNEEAYEIEITQASGSNCGYHCRLIDGNGGEKRMHVELVSRVRSRWTFRIDGKIADLVISRHNGQLLVDWNNRNYRLSLVNPKDIHAHAHADHEMDPRAIRADMTGKVVTVGKKRGDTVAPGEPLATVEAMKMLNQIKARKAGIVAKCHIEPGSVVKPGDLLFEIE